MDVLGAAPGPLLAIAAAGLGLGLALLLWLLRRGARALLRHPQRALHPLGLLGVMLACAASLVAGAAALGFTLALSDYTPFTGKTHVAEIQARQLGPQRLRLYYVPIERDGIRGPAETYQLEGERWQLGGVILKFSPLARALGVPAAHQVSRLAGHWRTTQKWLRLGPDGIHGPLSFLVERADRHTLTKPPDGTALYALFVTPEGYLLEPHP
jgi:hypothetical protein